MAEADIATTIRYFVYFGIGLVVAQLFMGWSTSAILVLIGRKESAIERRFFGLLTVIIA